MNTIYFSLFSYATLIFFIVKLPDKFWDFLLNSYKLWLTSLKMNKKKWPLIGEIKRGQELLISFSDCEARLSVGIKILTNYLPKYKFYTHLMEQLFDTHLRMGIGIKKIIPEIRAGLIRDLEFEKKILDEIFSGILQFLIIAATTWSFVLLSSSIIQMTLSKIIIASIILLQVSGTLIFFQLVEKSKTRIFIKFSKAFEELYLFTAFLEIGLPLNEILSKSEILQGNLVNFKIFENLSTRMSKLIGRLRETGLSPKVEAQEVIQEIWQLQNENFQKFNKMVQIFKFSILVFFFLPAYFLYLYSIFKFFMEQ